jgi:hypothetical protein
VTSEAFLLKALLDPVMAALALGLLRIAAIAARALLTTNMTEKCLS